MKKLWMILLAMLLATSMAFIGCGGGDEVIEEIPEGFEEIILELPATSDPPGATGELQSKLHIFTGAEFDKIKNAREGSEISVMYQASVAYACAEIGWVSQTKAGPVVSGSKSTAHRQTARVPLSYLKEVIEADKFTIHVFNGATIVEVKLLEIMEGTPIPKNAKATATGIPVFMPFGHEVNGNGDLAKTDFAFITGTATGNLVFYYSDDTKTDGGILKFGPKRGSPYLHYGMDADGTITEGDNGWKRASEEDYTIKIPIAQIKAAVTAAGAGFDKLEVNSGKAEDGNKLLYIEIIP